MFDSLEHKFDTLEHKFDTLDRVNASNFLPFNI